MQKTSSPVSMIFSGSFILLLLGVMYAWSIFRVELLEVYPGFTAAQLSLNFTLAMSFCAIGCFCSGKLSAKYSIRFSVRLSAGLLLVGFLGVSCMEFLEPGAALLLMYACYGVITGFGTGLGYNACGAGIPQWFPRHMSLVSGVLYMCYGVSSLLLGPLVQVLAGRMGIFNVFRLFGVVAALVLLLCSFTLRNAPVAQAAAAQDGQAAVPGYSPMQMLRSPAFWYYSLWGVLVNSAGLLVINSAANIVLYYGGAAAVGMLISVCNGGVRPLIGYLLDRRGLVFSLHVVNVVLVLACVLLLITGKLRTLATLIPGMLLVGLAYGTVGVSATKCISKFYGMRHYGVNLGITVFAIIPAAFLGPYISGWMLDLSGGDYGATYILMTAFALLAIVMTFLLQFSAKREGLGKPASEQSAV